jgi:hypothetical protein
MPHWKEFPPLDPAEEATMDPNFMMKVKHDARAHSIKKNPARRMVSAFL